MSQRPDPDALLAKLATEGGATERGCLKVYLGMAAGVGKTYTMLSDGQEAKRRGEDVVVGFLQAHGRRETEDLAEGLERIPLKEIPYQGITLEEFDLDAALARKPGLVLVDELAHTNAPGSRHRRRWQDVQELLSAGINVATTVNIQHFESLNDVVAQITGIIVTETLPDSVIQEAQDVELIDLTPDELIHRIKEGKVYIPQKVDQALDGFFKKRNLVALRELALRRTAEAVDQQVRTFRAAEGVKESWHTSERLLVCIAPNKLSTHVVRAAHNMANALHEEWYAVTVESTRQVSEAEAKVVYEALRLAEQLGAKTSILSGAGIADEIVRFAQAHNITTIVVAKPVQPRWKEILFGSVVDSLVRHSGDINIHVIRGVDDGAPPANPLAVRNKTIDWRGWGLSVVTVALATVACGLLDPWVTEAGKSMIYLLAVATVGFSAGMAESAFASLLAILCLNYFFTAPRGTFQVANPQYYVVFTVLAAVSLSISALATRTREEGRQSALRARRTAALYELSRKLAATRSRREIAEFAAEQVRNVFECDAAVLIKSRKTGELFSAPGSRSGFENDDKEIAVANWVADRGTRAGRFTDTLPGSSGLYLPLNAEKGCVGVLAVLLGEGRALDGAWEHLLQTYANQLAVAIERTNLAKNSTETHLEVEREKLRSALLSTVSHDLRTPLAVIAGSADQLRSSTTLTDPHDRELAEAVATEAERLERQVRNLLDMTRLESGSIELRPEWQSIEELIGGALLRCEPVLAGRSVKVSLPQNLPLLRLDGELMEHVFINLFENAARHTPEGAYVHVTGDQKSGDVEILFENNGPCLIKGEEEMIFRKFARSASTKGRGSGLGLAICRSIVEAHGGAIWAQSIQPQGVRFVISLPLPDKAPEAPVEH